MIAQAQLALVSLGQIKNSIVR